MTEAPGERDLVLSRFIPASRRDVYRAWTDAELLRRWFAPLPFTTPEAELDVRPGGTCRIVMRAPDGTDMPNAGVYLDVVENERLVITDAYTRAWEPSAKPFMTLVVMLSDEGEGTRYKAMARHWSVADRDAHEAMGFHAGWGQCADQLATLLVQR